MTKNIFHDKLSAIGAKIETIPGREIIGFSTKVLNEDAIAATELILESIVDLNIDPNQIEADKEIVHGINYNVSRDQFDFLNESIFYTCFRDHMVG